MNPSARRADVAAVFVLGLYVAMGNEIGVHR
jgi:hypothetical protein